MAMNEKATTYVVSDISIIAVAIIKIHIDKNTINDVLLDGGSRVNIIIEQLRARLQYLSQNLFFIICGISNYNQTNRIDQGSRDVCSWHTIHNYIYSLT